MYVLPYQQSAMGCRLEGVERWEVGPSDARVGLQISRSRRMPWLKIARVPRFGRGIPTGARAEVIRQITEVARARNVLRLHLEIWSESSEELHELEGECEAQGMVAPPVPRSYEHTVWIDLRSPDEDLLARFHPTCRRHIRAPAKKGYEVRRIVSDNARPQLESMFRGAFERTGGRAPHLDWGELIRQAAADSADIHLVGLFAAEDVTSSRPVAFATAMLHGQVAEYAHAGSTRDPAIKIPLLYAPTWELIRWAKARGAIGWDFGGVAVSDTPDSRSGIDQFKFSFSDHVTRVGHERVLQCSRLPWPLRPVPRRSGPGGGR